MCEELEALYYDYANSNMEDPNNKALVAGIALPFIKSLPARDQADYMQRLCTLIKVDPKQLLQMMST
jgi:hypothetical protein